MKPEHKVSPSSHCAKLASFEWSPRSGLLRPCAHWHLAKTRRGCFCSSGTAAGPGAGRTAAGGLDKVGRGTRDYAPAGPKLQSFWAALPLAEVTTDSDGQQVLSLAQNACFPGSWALLRQVLRRRCYDTVFEKMEEYVNKPSPTCVRRFLVLGTPGIGKSVFLLDLLHRLACSERTVVLYSPLTYPKALLFKPGADIYGRSVYEADNPSSFMDELTDPDTWLLCDSVEFAQMDAVTVMTSSPHYRAYNAFAKTTHLELWMGPWTHAEVHAAYRLEPHCGKVDERAVDRLFDTWGGIPRYVLESAMIPSMQRKLDDAIACSDLLAVLRSAKQIEAAPEASHKLLHVQVNDACEKQAVVLGSEVIARRVTEKLQANGSVALRQFLAWSAGEPTTASLRGLLFRAYSFDLLSRGGTFRVRELCSAGGSSAAGVALALPQVARLDVADLAAAMPGCLVIPTQKTLPAIDCLLVLPPGGGVLRPTRRLLLIQATASSSHSVNDAELAAQLAELPPALRRLKPVLLFAVPPDVFTTIGAQKTTGTGALGAVKQYALEVPIGGFESSSSSSCSSGSSGGGSSSSHGGSSGGGGGSGSAGGNSKRSGRRRGGGAKDGDPASGGNPHAQRGSVRNSAVAAGVLLRQRPGAGVGCASCFRPLGRRCPPSSVLPVRVAVAAARSVRVW